jgi:hypothetical protein
VTVDGRVYICMYMPVICTFSLGVILHDCNSGYFEKTTFLKDCKTVDGTIDFYDSNSGKLLFTAPKGRTLEDFLVESRNHGWPSFRNDEVNWENVRILPDGEAVSVDGTHLGHNIPDKKGMRYCINLVSVAGNPVEDNKE